MAKLIRSILPLFTVFVTLILSYFTSDAIEFLSYKLQRQHRHHRRNKQAPYLTDLKYLEKEEENSGNVVDQAMMNESNVEDFKLNDSEWRNLTYSAAEGKSRKKRGTFAWPPGALFVTQFSLEVPLYSPEGVGVPFLLEVPYEFELPNATKIIGRRKRSTEERFSFYRTIESLFGRFGYDGRSCMLRAVCERSESDLMTEGLLGEVLNMLLSVATSGSNSELLWEYHDAEDFGSRKGDCSEKFKSCPISIFRFFDP